MSRFGLVKKPDEVTVADLRQAFPSKKDTITQELADTINYIQNDPEGAIQNFMETLVEYQGVMQTSGSSMKDYIKAVKFCAHLEAEDYNIVEAYKKSRSNEKFVRDRWDAPTDSAIYRELTSAASRYHKDSKLVRQILTQSDMPLYLMFQGARYKAVSVLVTEMETAVYSKDRIAAADKLLAHVKAPENNKVELEIGVSQEVKTMQQSLEEQLARVADAQYNNLIAGADIRDVQKLGIKTDIIEAEVE